MAKAEVKSPLTETHYTQLKTLQKSINQTREYLLKCQRCKLDVDEEAKATEDQLAVVAGLLKEFFPNKPQ